MPALFSPRHEPAQAAQKILLQRRSPTLARALITRLHATEWTARLRAVELLAELGLTESSAALVELLEDHYPHIRSAVIGALERLGPPGLEDLLLRRLRDEDEGHGVRIAAAMALGRVSGVPFLRRLATSSPELSQVIEEVEEYLQASTASETRSATRLPRADSPPKL